MFAVENLTVRAGHASLLSGVSAWITPGRVVAIAGPNGAGKSTLLSCLAGLRDADAGSVILDGEPLGARSAAERARLIGYLPQEAALHWNISVRSLVSLGRYPHRHAMAGDTGEDERAIQIALAAAGLEALADRPVRTLSGGERARAMLARVLATEPAWILADEPLAALDIAHRHEIMHLLQGIAARGVGVVVVIHDLALARRTADEALLLDGGRLVAAGPVEDVLSPARLGPVFGVDFALVPAADGIETLVASPPLS